MSNDWFPTGVTDLKPFKFDESVKQHLVEELSDKGINITENQAFISDLENAIALYHASRKVQSDSTPGITRNNLAGVMKQAIKLYNLMGKLDPESMRLIGEISGSDFNTHKKQLLGTIKAIESTQQYAQEYPLKPSDHARLLLAVKTAEAIETHLNTRPTSTKDGLYVAMLEITLATATSKEAKDVNDLASRGLKAYHSRL